LRYRASLFEIHEIHVDGEVVEGEGGEETLIFTSCRYPKKFIFGIALVFFSEFDGVGWFNLRLRQVPNLKVFILIDGKKLTDSGCETRFVISKVLSSFKYFFVFRLLHFCIVKVKQTPPNLCYSIVTLMVPHSNRCSKFFIIKPTQMILK